MGSRDNHPGISAHGGGDKGNTRGRQGAENLDIDPHGADPGGKGVFDHVARKPGVLADNDLVALGLAFDDKGNRPADLHGDFRGHGIDIGDSAYAVGSKEFSHGWFLV